MAGRRKKVFVLRSCFGERGFIRCVCFGYEEKQYSVEREQACRHLLCVFFPTKYSKKLSLNYLWNR